MPDSLRSLRGESEMTARVILNDLMDDPVVVVCEEDGKWTVETEMPLRDELVTYLNDYWGQDYESPPLTYTPYGSYWRVKSLLEVHEGSVLEVVGLSPGPPDPLVDY